jgi:cystathionine beta-lyase
MIPGFDTRLDRRGRNALKWRRHGPEVLPLWVADMDCAAPPAVLSALHAAIEHGVFGYGEAEAEDAAAVCDHQQSRFGWMVSPDWLLWCPGLGTALHLVGHALGATGGSILTLAPHYPPFVTNPRRAGFTVLTAPLAVDGDRQVLDLDALDAACRADTRLLLLCHPHNPTGRCWSRPELETLAAWAMRRDLLIVSDEVHADLILEPGLTHIPFATLGDEVARRTITLQAASKAYNLPGLKCGYLVAPDPTLRRHLATAMQGLGLHIPPLGYIATRAAYRHGATWLSEVLVHLRAHRDHLHARLRRDLPAIRHFRHEATYLAWLDCRDLGLADPFAHFLAAGVALSDGAEFGAPGFLRLNLGCHRSVLDQALDRMAGVLP